MGDGGVCIPRLWTASRLIVSWPWMVLVDSGGVDPLLETPRMGVKGELTSLQGAGVPGTVIYPGGVPASRRPGRFTSMAVPRFDGTVCWQQHQQVFNTIVKSNSWDDEMAALQLFAHLEAETLNVALLVREGKPATWQGLSLGLSEYYTSPGRLAVLRRKFDSVVCRDWEDPTAFATKLEILAVRGFGDVRTRMARDRFISEQRSCGLRHHLDSVPLNTPIRDIVDRCRVWESHSDQNRRPPLGTNVGREHPAVASDSRECSFYMEDPSMTATSLELEPKVPVSVVYDVMDDGSFCRGEWDRAVSDRSVNCAGFSLPDQQYM